MTQQIDSFLSGFHFSLSNYTMPPILGSIPAAVKIVAGVVETVVSIIFTFLLVVASIFSKRAKPMLHWSAIHVAEGVKRILIGSLLAIPVFGIAVFYSLNRIEETVDSRIRNSLKADVEDVERVPFAINFLG